RKSPYSRTNRDSRPRVAKSSAHTSCRAARPRQRARRSYRSSAQKDEKRRNASSGPLLRRMPPVAQKFQHHQPSPHHDRGISDVEGVPVISPKVEINEVRHAVAHKPVEHVARGAAKNQGQAELPQPPARAP